MKLSFIKTIAVCALAAVAMTSVVRAEDKAKPEATQEGKKDRPVGFYGKINSIDMSAKSISIGKDKKRTIYITDKTKITRDGKPAMLDAAKVGDDVGGSYREVGGKMEAGSLRIGPKVEGETKPKKRKDAADK